MIGRRSFGHHRIFPRMFSWAQKKKKFNSVGDAFDDLQGFVDAKFEPVLEYIETNYIGGHLRNSRKLPLFWYDWLLMIEVCAVILLNQ